MVLASVQIASSLQKALNGFLGFIPNLLGFLVILIIGYVIARVVRGVITKLLQKAKLDDALHSGQSGSIMARVGSDVSPSALIAGVELMDLFVGHGAVLGDRGVEDPGGDGVHESGAGLSA